MPDPKIGSPLPIGQHCHYVSDQLMLQAPFVLALLPTIILGIICRLALGGPYRPGAGTAATYERSVLTGGEPEANGAPNNLIPLPGWWAPFLDLTHSGYPKISSDESSASNAHPLLFDGRELFQPRGVAKIGSQAGNEIVA
ncbi:hypothetical protein CBS147323_7276 [Aspergillus niger]|nr:hypothetical protein CBS11350_5213 [Aspergillus niger]KAI2890430.1 hypothetical protein CBS13152_5513 [Aspergillus niger]KAI2962589.1 hypothetical protein CBS147323_7276 [Aspergillus niger]KAI3080173.1 hypothetical protein CBS147353_3580 [Aspergillus niger]